MDATPEAGVPDDGALSDPDGAVARRRWAQLPAPIDPQQWTITQPVQHGPIPETDHEIARNLLLWGMG